MDFCVNIITFCCLFSNYHIICSFFPKGAARFWIFPDRRRCTEVPAEGTIRCRKWPEWSRPTARLCRIPIRLKFRLRPRPGEFLLLQARLRQNQNLVIVAAHLHRVAFVFLHLNHAASQSDRLEMPAVAPVSWTAGCPANRKRTPYPFRGRYGMPPGHRWGRNHRGHG